MFDFLKGRAQNWRSQYTVRFVGAATYESPIMTEKEEEGVETVVEEEKKPRVLSTVKLKSFTSI